MAEDYGYTHSKPVPQRRSHKKSTNGCISCKARKVKCDEKKPVCGKCAIHFTNLRACEYQLHPAQKRTKAVTIVALAPKVAVSNSSRFTPPLCNDTGSIVSSKILKDRQFAYPSIDPQSNRLLCNPPAQTVTRQCRCPCHFPEFTTMLMDALFGICRICGNNPAISLDTCTPAVPPSLLVNGTIDPFHVLPPSASPRVYELLYHWTNTLALFPTKIHTQYCTNPSWMQQAISNEALFNVTVYVCSIHTDGLAGHRESRESLFYKSETIRVLNGLLRDPKKATTDETISAVFLLVNVLSLIGESSEVRAHLNGLRRMIDLRGGFQVFSIDGVFLHMLCTTNHLSAVLSESQNLLPSKSPYVPPSGCYNSSVSSETQISRVNRLCIQKFEQTGCSRLFEFAQKQHFTSDFSFALFVTTQKLRVPKASPTPPKDPLRTSLVFVPFAADSGWSASTAKIFHDMGYLYDILNTFTDRLVPYLRSYFLQLSREVESEARGGPVAKYIPQNPERLTALELRALTEGVEFH